MFDDDQRQEFEDNAIDKVKLLYNYLANDRQITYTIPSDIYSHWDMKIEVDGKKLSVENKTRNYHYDTFNDYYIDVTKADLDLFNVYFPLDDVIAVTTNKKLNDCPIKYTKIKKMLYCDNESKGGYRTNLAVPRDKFWIYSMSNENPKLVSSPK
jgi:hypothetical protein